MGDQSVVARIVLSSEDIEKVIGSTHILFDLARLNPYRLPMQEAPGHYVERRDCSFCGSTREFEHDPGCLWRRAKGRVDALEAAGMI